MDAEKTEYRDDPILWSVITISKKELDHMISEVQRACSIPPGNAGYPIFGYEDDVARLTHYRWMLDKVGSIVQISE